MEMQGGADLLRGLKALARDDELDTVKMVALEDAGAPIRDAVKLEAPFDEGRLFTAVEMESDFSAAKKVKTRSGLAIWVRHTNDYRPLKRVPEGKAKRSRYGYVKRDYQKGSVPAVYGAFLNFLSRFGGAVGWMDRGWNAEGGQPAVDRAKRSLADSLVILVKRRFSGR